MSYTAGDTNTCQPHETGDTGKKWPRALGFPQVQMSSE